MLGDKTEKDGYVDLLRHQTTLARFGELALRSNDLDEILTEACRLAGDALGTDLAKVVELQDDGKTLVVHSARPARTLPDLIKWIDQKGLELEDIHLKRPTLEDVFIELTGKKLRD